VEQQLILNLFLETIKSHLAKHHASEFAIFCKRSSRGDVIDLDDEEKKYPMLKYCGKSKGNAIRFKGDEKALENKEKEVEKSKLLIMNSFRVDDLYC